ncbi:MAG: ChaN family lipoprotein [Bacteroidia bacterium]|nr:ChaN family lipoprotein [Bacteroidia bacterium]MCX7764194.1 ChaN family lipoprotein [Bacteroidia bacterium]MDW8057248.1 ChaN family lipoprotein [Bacteroidia bacterium]
MRLIRRKIYLLWLLATSFAQDKPAYLLFSSDGKRLSYRQVLHRLLQADVIFFGELHDDPIAHWLALELVKDLHAKRKLVLGMEMFETDQQEPLNRYLRGEIDLHQLGEEVRLWPNFSTDYAPLLAYAQKEKIPVYATNAPRSLAREVARSGASALEMWDESKRHLIAPLPFPRLDSLPSYQKMSEMAASHGIRTENFRLAQMLKDATMAYRIHQTWQAGTLFFHLNGAYHSDYHEGIVAYLRLYAPYLRVVTISTQRVEAPLKYKPPKEKIADIILVVPESMTRTHG